MDILENEWETLPVILWNPHEKKRGQDYSEGETEELIQEQTGLWHTMYKRYAFRSPNTNYAEITTGGGNRLTSQNFSELEKAENAVPPFLWRVSALGGWHRTTGLSSPAIYLPNANLQKILTYEHITHMTIEDGANMLGAHLRWKNPVEDQFLSWTNSIFFWLTHIIRRHEQGQKGIHNAFGDIRKLKKRDESQASFYLANTLLETLPIEAMYRLTDRERERLHPRHFTHESVSFNEMRDPLRAIVHVTLESLVQAGLFELCPELVLRYDTIRSCLYRHQVALKRMLFYNAKAADISKKDLLIAFEIAGLFKPHPTAKPPLMAFINLLAYRKRPKLNPAYRSWMKENYSGSDVLECVYLNMHKVPENLPDVIQSIELLQEAALVLSLDDFPQYSIEKLSGSKEYPYSERNLTEYEISTQPKASFDLLLAITNFEDATKQTIEQVVQVADQLDGEDKGGSTDEDNEVGLDVSPGLASTPSVQPTNHQKRKASKLLMRMDLLKRRKLRKGMNLDDIKRLQRRIAGRVQRMRKSRQNLQECHADFETYVKPRLIASLAPGETWI